MIAQRLITLFISCVIAACGSKIDLYSGMTEQDANEVVSALIQVGVDSKKLAIPKKGFSVQIDESQLAVAVSHLYKMGLPRNNYQRMGDVFKKDGVVSTPVEERSRYLYALSQELEHTLSQIDGVIVARVHPVLPEKTLPGEPAQRASCSVLIKHRIGWQPQLYEEKIRSLVVSSIPGLGKAPRSAVSIIFVASEKSIDEFINVEFESKRSESNLKLSVSQWLIIFLLILIGLSSGSILIWQLWLERKADQTLPKKIEPTPLDNV